MSEENINQLLKHLDSDDLATRYKAAFELMKQNRSEGIPVIVDYINQRHFQYLDSYTVVDQLANVQDERVTEALIGMLDMPAHVVGNALNSLLAIGSERSVDAVFTMLMTPSPWFGWGTAQLIADYGERYLERLLETRQHENPLMRARSIAALSFLARSLENPVVAESALIDALKDQDRNVRERAAQGLAQLSSNSAHAALQHVLTDDDVEVSQWAAEGLYKAGLEVEKALSLLMETLKHRDWLIQRNAVWALKRIADKRSVSSLIHTLQYAEHRAIRAYAAEALADIGDKSCIDAVQSALEDQDELVRAACVKALAQLVGYDAMSQIAALRADKSVAVQQAVIEVWEQYGFQPDNL
ncbi:MAG: hypothetical protein GYB68_01670 [Chloroflexi bacterium]|nr:hypothetical protein [Chloroflexota bacterium]